MNHPFSENPAKNKKKKYFAVHTNSSEKYTDTVDMAVDMEILSNLSWSTILQLLMQTKKNTVAGFSAHENEVLTIKQHGITTIRWFNYHWLRTQYVCEATNWICPVEIGSEIELVPHNWFWLIWQPYWLMTSFTISELRKKREVYWLIKYRNMLL